MRHTRLDQTTSRLYQYRLRLQSSLVQRSCSLTYEYITRIHENTAVLVQDIVRRYGTARRREVLVFEFLCLTSSLLCARVSCVICQTSLVCCCAAAAILRVYQTRLQTSIQNVSAVLHELYSYITQQYCDLKNRKNRRFEDFVCYTVILVVLPYYIPVVCTSRYTSSREEEYIRSPLFSHILQLYIRLMGGKYTQ